MSLLNQVLRDLDQRQVTGTPPAVKAASPRTLAPSAAQRATRWGLGLFVTLAAVVVGGWAQGSIRWPAQAADTPVAAAPLPLAPATLPAVTAPMPVTPAAPTPAPAPVATPAETPPAPAPVVARETAPVQVAIAAPAPRSKPVAAAQPVSDNTVATASKPESRIELRSAARSAQERAEAQYQRGVTAHQAGQINDSAAAFTAALREDPRHAAARVAQAGMLIALSRPDEAMALLKEGLALAPAQPQLALMLARLQAERQEWATAAETLQAASSHAGLNAGEGAEFHGFHAAILQRAGRHGDAVEKYSVALRLVPTRGVWWMGLAISLEEIGQADTARAAFQRAKSIGLPEGAAGYVDSRLKQLG
ncbi:tetratricopeptide repeat protein [Piscinibacter sp. HJYY11]|uniref:tetratricopeptide repeat protein n=1 Tax=Piscinibacter sp. HJYY11 TaxID=2801333 RepID=UPI00191D604D|nr:tetratricopeptide repeat protein [Piscinibacter sp. HJYY11]MBL0727833.1 tetratricopeptide repeat protein [Piscinibacter sp. HJYY11]